MGLVRVGGEGGLGRDREEQLQKVQQGRKIVVKSLVMIDVVVSISPKWN